MTELDQVIATAYSDSTNLEKTNKVYQVFLRSLLYVPIEQLEEEQASSTDEQQVLPLIANYDGNYFMVAFDTQERLQQWAGEQYTTIASVQISGRDLIDGITNELHLCLNVGCAYYKEFFPDEVRRLKTVIFKTKRPSERAQSSPP